ncbi:MAG: tRNA pseudouridine(38-40) synthase TruA [Firmicutes bacterium]|nr:tRNA pseudouridine(38-40) synthase TruA [Bacillota bacterium]
MRIKLIITYDGTDFCGWQRQPNGISIQQELEDAYFKFSGERVTITGSGRTDEGVHAIAQVAHFNTEKILSKKEAFNFVNAFNFHLPSNIRVKSAEIVDDNFHAVVSALKKTYHYDMYFGIENPLLKNRAYHIKKNIDIAAMERAAKCFIGNHDFVFFRAVGSSATTTVREIYNCELTEVELYGSSGLRLSISANGFLYKMVRIIVGSILQVGLGKLIEIDIKKMLCGKEELIGYNKTTAPSCGLYLQSVKYD